MRTSLWLVICVMVVLVAGLSAARGDVQVYAQPPAAGALHKSAWYPPDGLDGDEYAFDSFVLASDTAITQIRWRGGYPNSANGLPYAPVSGFTVSIYRSTAGLLQPDVLPGGRLVRYTYTGNAGETPATVQGGIALYDYAVTLPTPFVASAGVPYWVQITASQGLAPSTYWPPDWSFANASGGNGSYFRKITGGPYQMPPGDLAFSLYSATGPTVTITANVLPAGAGTVTGAGPYPQGSTATLTATAASGWGFVNWTEGGSIVSLDPRYVFPASGPRTLTANFVPAFTLHVVAQPSYGGSVTGAGVYNQSSTATVTATPNPGYAFTGWSDGSTEAVHTVTIDAELWLTALFTTDGLSAAFDFDNATVGSSLPLSLTSGGIGAAFSATGSGYSIQRLGTVGLWPAGFEGNCLYPNSVFPADLIIDFSEPIAAFRIMFSPQELGCDTTATMRATGWRTGVPVAIATAQAPVPGSWPTGTLELLWAGGFDRVVVHYDQRPLTCQDYGMIFLADNMTVTRVCTPPSVITHPADAVTCPNAPVSFTAAASGSVAAFRWQAVPPSGGGFVDLADGTLPDGTGVIGSGSDTLTLAPATVAGPWLVRCVMSAPCGTATSAQATLTVQPCGCSIADVVSIGGLPPADGLLTGDDFNAFIAAFAAGDALADIVAIGGLPPGDGLITGDDFVAFISAFALGCP